MIMPDKMAKISKRKASYVNSLREFCIFDKDMEDNTDNSNPQTLEEFQIFAFIIENSEEPSTHTKEQAKTYPCSQLIKTC